jgi:hypothetical protein
MGRGAQGAGRRARGGGPDPADVWPDGARLQEIHQLPQLLEARVLRVWHAVLDERPALLPLGGARVLP